MKLASFAVPDNPGTAESGWAAYSRWTGEVRGDEVVTWADPVTMRDLLAAPNPSPPDGRSYPLSDVTLLDPVQPRAIFGVGLNYADHAAETGATPPEVPIVFMKLPTSSTAPNGTVAIPGGASSRLDYEGELAIVMGENNAIAGYAVANDLSARDLQRREPQWTRAKGFDNSCPWGPWITTPDEVGDVRSLSLKTWVNGELRQDGNTANLIFGPEEIVNFLCETCTLEPGDLIVTGTPAGVGIGMNPMQFLASGDTVRIEIERLGAIEHTIA